MQQPMRARALLSLSQHGYVTLGPDGLPVYNLLTNDPYPQNNPIDVNSNGELTWWSTTNPNVTLAGTGTVSLPYS